MRRNASGLNGLSIIAVVLNHAAGWAFIAMFWWTDRYRDVAVPNYDAINSPEYMVNVFFKGVTIFCVPFFLFLSGYFSAYAIPSGSKRSWKPILERLQGIVIPYLIWSAIAFLYNLVDGVTYSPWEYLRRLLAGEAFPQYFYVSAIIQLYLLSYWIIPLVRKNWKISLAAAAGLQLFTIGVRYVEIFTHTPVAVPSILVTNFLVYFVFGAAAFMNARLFSEKLTPLKWPLLVGLVLGLIAALVEPEVIYQTYGVDLRGGINTLSTAVYVTLFLLTAIAFDSSIRINNKTLNFLGQNVFGIYLLHPLVMELLSRIFYHFLPALLGQTLIFFVLLAGLTFGISVLAVWLASKVNFKMRKLVFG